MATHGEGTMAARRRPYNTFKEKGCPGMREEIVLRKNFRLLVEKLTVSDVDILQNLIDLLVEVGILDSDEYRVVLNSDRPGVDFQPLIPNRAARLILAAVLDSGHNAFVKFMDALRAAGYTDVAADLEQELENTIAPPSETPNRNRSQSVQETPSEAASRIRRDDLAQFVRGDSMSTVATRSNGDSGDISGGGNGVLGQIAVAATNSLITAGLQRYGHAPQMPIIGYTVRYRRRQIGDDVASTWDVDTSLNVTPDLVMGLLTKMM